jgi:hypothetical protein
VIAVSDDFRVRGVEFGDLRDDLESLEYPVSCETLVDRFGSRELDLVDGSATLGEVLSRDPDDRTYRSAEAVRRAATRLVDSDAVGYEGYTDRGTDAPGGAEGSGMD